MAELASDRDSFRATEVCKEADVAPYVLRYWVTEFPSLAADKDKTANRAFSSRDLRIIVRIRELLYDEGFTIAGAKKRIEAEISGGVFDGPPGKTVRAKPAVAEKAAVEIAPSPAPIAAPPPSAPRRSQSLPSMS